MTKLVFEFNSGDVEIELLDNDFVKVWLPHFQKMKKKYSYRFYPSNLPQTFTREQTKENWSIVEGAILRTKGAIEELNTLGYDFPYTLDVEHFNDTEEFQEKLNLLHRAFTTGSNTLNRWFIDGEPTYKVPDNDEDIALFQKLIHIINHDVHILESYVNTGIRTKFDKQYQYAQLEFDCSRIIDVDYTAPGAWQQLAPGHEKFHTIAPFDVWIKKDILGKDYLTAFFDADTASGYDVTPMKGYTGGILIDVNHTRQKVMQSDEFKQWLTEAGQTLNNMHGSIPLGTIISNRKIIEEFIRSDGAHVLNDIRVE